MALVQRHTVGRSLKLRLSAEHDALGQLHLLRKKRVELMITILILFIALGILGLGFYRARPYSKLGILAWLQSVVLMMPWLLFFGLFAVGIYLNLAAVLLMLVISAGAYIVLGNRLRAAGQDPNLAKKLATHTSLSPSDNNSMPPVTIAAVPSSPAADGSSLPTELTIPAEDLQAIKGIFGVDTFFAVETFPYQEGAIFRGNLRGEAEAVYAQLSQSLTDRLSDRYRLFLVEGPDDRPVVIVLPSTNDPKPTKLSQKILAATLMLTTIATTLETAGLLQGFDLFNHLERWREALPIGLGILLILAAHEIGHRLLASRHHIRLSPPFFLPALQLSSFGAITRIESWLPDRKVLFDIGFAGPAASGIISLAMLITGLSLSHQGSLFQIPAEFFQGSILVGTLARVVLGTALQQSLVDVHPLVVVGWLGLVITAINLMPAGQLDGGRIVQSIYGRKIARRATIATLIVLGLASLVNPLALYWAILILFLQRDLERPALNELTEPDDARAALGLLVLFLMVATLLPLTPSLAGRLGIGG
jgi:membrane-associated protease RseP (regulator of RpoE activity)